VSGVPKDSMQRGVRRDVDDDGLLRGDVGEGACVVGPGGKGAEVDAHANLLMNGTYIECPAVTASNAIQSLV